MNPILFFVVLPVLVIVFAEFYVYKMKKIQRDLYMDKVFAFIKLILCFISPFLMGLDYLYNLMLKSNSQELSFKYIKHSNNLIVLLVGIAIVEALHNVDILLRRN